MTFLTVLTVLTFPVNKQGAGSAKTTGYHAISVPLGARHGSGDIRGGVSVGDIRVGISVGDIRVGCLDS